MAAKTGKNVRRGITAVAALCLLVIGSAGCSAPAKQGKDRLEGTEAAFKASGGQPAEPRSEQSKAVDPAVEAELERIEAEKRATLLKDAQSAIEETQSALAALDRGDGQAAIAALGQAEGKLDLVVARDPKMARAPVAVTTSVLDLYATPETVKAVLKEARDDLSNERVQHARLLVQDLCSEADIHVAEIPLATYPAAIKTVAPLVDAGRMEEAKAALYAALNTLVIETFVVPLPKIRASAMLTAAGELADKKDRTADDTTRMHALVDATRQQLQLAEALGYGTKDSYKPLYAQLDEIQKKAEAGQSGGRPFDRLRNSLKNFKFST